MNIKLKISDPNQQCDLLPYGSVHEVNASIPFPFEYVKDIPTKTCPYCTIQFAVETPFVKPSQTGDTEMCIRCHERKYVVGRDEYREALLKQFNTQTQ